MFQKSCMMGVTSARNASCEEDTRRREGETQLSQQGLLNARLLSISIGESDPHEIASSVCAQRPILNACQELSGTKSKGSHKQPGAKVAVQDEENSAEELKGDRDGEVMLVLERQNGIDVKSRSLGHETLSSVKLGLHVADSRAPEWRRAAQVVY